jgi:hypothetical protein
LEDTIMVDTITLMLYITTDITIMVVGGEEVVKTFGPDLLVELLLDL